MANFEPAFQKTMKAEGGFVLHHVKNDRGGQTYAGIARNAWPKWPGWQHIDAGGTPPTDLVREFYRANFWDVIQGNAIRDQAVAENIYDAAVNFGTRTAVMLAQAVVGATPDGKIGPRTLDALDNNEAGFVDKFALACIARYEQIVTRNRTQEKFLLGWVRRTLRRAAS